MKRALLLGLALVLCACASSRPARLDEAKWDEATFDDPATHVEEMP